MVLLKDPGQFSQLNSFERIHPRTVSDRHSGLEHKRIPAHCFSKAATVAMIITEVNSFVDLVKKATSFAFQLQDGWYKGSAEVERFQDQVLMLSEKHDQWTAQLRRHGLSEDKRLLLAVQLAVQVLEKQQQYVTKLQKNPLLRLTKKAFPAQLSYSLNRVSEIVDTGPQLLASRVATNDLLEKSGVQTPAPLPFVSDPNYVPISKSVKEIQDALERPEGPRVVTVYGEPGVGKSSVVKFIALHYAEQRKKLLNGTLFESPTFPDGVFYLCCGQEAKGRVNQLQRELTDCLGFGASSSGPTNDSTAACGQEGQFFQQISSEMKLRSRLVEQKLLIILDDLWEGEVLEQLLVPANGVKYLITSQMREIWGAAEKIQLGEPTFSEARHILANYTDGLPTKGEFPENIKGVTDEIISKLAYHPLSLANVGISINRSRVSDASHWKAISADFHILLDKNDLQGSPVTVYNMPYSLTVGEAMMLMVESLRPEPRKLLFLIALLEGEQLPETLVKFFYKFVKGVQANDFLLTYNNEEKYLEDRSLVTLHTPGPNDTTLTAHNLRTHYIREKKTLDLQSIASQIVPSSDQRVELIQGGDAEETLLTVLCAMYYRRPFTNVVVNALQRHVQVITDGVVPRNINSGTDLIELVKGTRRHVGGLLFLLNVDLGDPDWKQQAHGYARRIIIKLACRGKLDDHSMACLIQLPQTTAKACEALRSIWYVLRSMTLDFLDQQNTFSSAHPETMNTLRAFVYDSATWTTFPVVIRLLVDVLDSERKETIVEVGTECLELLVMDSNPTLQIAIAEVLRGGHEVRRSMFIMCEFTDLLEVLLGLLVSGKDDKVRASAGKTLVWFCDWEYPALKIARIPDVLATLYNLFLSMNTRHEGAGVILEKLLRDPENRRKFQVNNRALEGLGDILAKVEGTWRAAHQREDRVMLEEQASIAAGLLSELALEEGVKESIVSLPGVQEGLLFLQATEVAKLLPLNDRFLRDGLFYNLYRRDRTRSIRALTILFSNPAEARVRGVPSIGDLEVFLPDADLLSKTSCVADGYLFVNYMVSLTQMLMHLEMGAYRAAVQSLDVAQHHLDRFVEGGPHCFEDHWFFPFRDESHAYVETTRENMACFISLPISRIRMSLQAMLEDQAGALLAANTILEDCELSGPMSWGAAHGNIVLIERGIIKRLCGDYQGALDDLNLAYVREGDIMDYFWDKNVNERGYDILKHRGYVKYLMNDEAGAREDAEAAHKFRCGKMERTRTFHMSWKQSELWELQKQPINYLGYFLK